MTFTNPISTPDAPSPAGPYSQAVRAGDFVFLAGQTARKPGESLDPSTSREDQCRQALLNLSAVATAAGGSLADAVKVTVYLSDLDWKSTFDQVYSDFEGLRAARTTVRAEPPTGSVEVDAILYLPTAAAADGSPA